MRISLVIAAACLVLATAAQAQKIELKTTKDSVSYALGINIGMNLKAQNIEIDPDIMSAAIKARYTDGTLVCTEEKAQEIMIAYQQKLMAKQQAENTAKAAKNKEEGDQFLSENAKKPGVKVLASGLQYQVLTEGKGPVPTKEDKVRTHYKGTLINGKEFDSSYKRGEPAVFPVTGVIRGWVEALQLMPVGSKWKLFIPSDLAYGERGAGPDIGPGAVLIFELELLGIEPKDDGGAKGDKSIEIK